MHETERTRLYAALKAKDLATVEAILTSGIQLEGKSPSGMGWVTDMFVLASWYHVWLAWKAGASAEDTMPAVKNRIAAWANGSEPPPERPAPPAPAPEPHFDLAVDAAFRLQAIPVASVRLTRDDDVLSGAFIFQPGHLDGRLTTLRLELEDLPFDAEAFDAGRTAVTGGEDGMSGGDSGYEGSISLGDAHHHVDVTTITLKRRANGHADVHAVFALQLEDEGIGVPNQAFTWTGTVPLGA